MFSIGVTTVDIPTAFCCSRNLKENDQPGVGLSAVRTAMSVLFHVKQVDTLLE